MTWDEKEQKLLLFLARSRVRYSICFFTSAFYLDEFPSYSAIYAVRYRQHRARPRRELVGVAKIESRAPDYGGGKGEFRERAEIHRHQISLIPEIFCWSGVCVSERRGDFGAEVQRSPHSWQAQRQKRIPFWGGNPG